MFITRDFSRYVERNPFYLIEELKKHIELTVWYDKGDIHDILTQLPTKPDFILLNDFKESRCPTITGLETLLIPFGVIVHDLHYKLDKRKQFIKDNQIENLFVVYRDAFRSTFKEFKEKMTWLPHFINPSIFKDYRYKKEKDYLLIGRRDWYYPLREKIYERMKNEDGFFSYKHPGYRDVDEQNEQNVFVGEEYAKEINRAKIFLTDNSTLKYPLIKYYEVLACNTLLLAPTSRELEDLGFIPGVHFVHINEDDFYEKAKYYLEHEDERLQIAQAGHDMVHQFHTVEVRAKQLINIISTIIQRD